MKRDVILRNYGDLLLWGLILFLGLSDFNIIFLVLSLRGIYNNVQGIKVSFENNTISYPTLFGMLRLNVPISNITNVSTSIKTSISNKGNISFTHYLEVFGSDFSKKIRFNSRTTRDQLFYLLTN